MNVRPGLVSRSPRKSLRLVVVLTVALGGLVACGNGDKAAVSQSPTAAEETSAVVKESVAAVEETPFAVVTYPHDGPLIAGDAALLTGVLTVERGCLAVEGGNTDEAVVLVLPEDEVELMEDGGVRLFGEERYLGRGGVSLGGGFGKAMPGFDLTVPEGCDPQNDTVAFHAWTLA